MAIPKKKRRTITVRNLKFSWALSSNWAECEDGTHLYIRPQTDAVAPLDVSFVHWNNDPKGYFPLFKQRKNLEKGHHEGEFLVFTPGVVKIVIVWALDNGWESQSANLVRASFNNGFKWIGFNGKPINTLS